MTKMKTHKSMKKRFRVTGTGKLKRSRPGRRHLLTKKSSNKKRQLRCPVVDGDTKQMKSYAGLIGAGA